MPATIRRLTERDLDEADRIFRLAFGTFLGLPDPLQFAGDSDWTRTRFRTDPEAPLGAELDGRLVGSNFVTTGGSVGFFGPLTVHPDLWEAGIAKQLLAATMEVFGARRTRHAGLFTFAQSAKHVHLYQRFGFWPRQLTMVMAKVIDGAKDSARTGWSTFARGDVAGVNTARRDEPGFSRESDWVLDDWR